MMYVEKSRGTSCLFVDVCSCIHVHACEIRVCVQQQTLDQIVTSGPVGSISML